MLGTDLKVGREYLARIPNVGPRRVRITGTLKHGWVCESTGVTEPGKRRVIRACHFVREIPDTTALPTDSLEEMSTTDLMNFPTGGSRLGSSYYA